VDRSIHPFACDAAAYVALPDIDLAAYSAATSVTFALEQIPIEENSPNPDDYIDAFGASSEEQKYQARLLREIVGNPFRPVVIDPSWLCWNGKTIHKLAQSIYENQAIEQLPILADALEEAGYTNPDILDHCRKPGEHVRGCWLVDLLLNKS
jgi:hypothetical protein